jgi:hypothetical protein
MAKSMSGGRFSAARIPTLDGVHHVHVDVTGAENNAVEVDLLCDSDYDDGDPQKCLGHPVKVCFATKVVRVFVSVGADGFDTDLSDEFNEREGALDCAAVSLEQPDSNDGMWPEEKDMARLFDIVSRLATFRTCARCDKGFVSAPADAGLDFCEACEAFVQSDADLEIAGTCTICTGDVVRFTAFKAACCGGGPVHKGCYARCEGKCPFCRADR